MRLSLRFIVPLAVTLALIAYAVVPLVDRFTLRWFERDLDIRTSLIANALQDPLEPLIREGSRTKVLRLFDRILQDERLFALGFCNLNHTLTYKTLTFPTSVTCAVAGGERAASVSRVVNLGRGPIHVAIRPVEADGVVYGSLVLVHDMSFVQRRSDDTKKYVFYLFAVIAAVISLVTVVIAEISWRGWVAGFKALVRGETFGRGAGEVRMRELRPVARDLQALIRDLESERRTRDESQINWSPETLRMILRNDLKGEEVLIVSNREPYLPRAAQRAHRGAAACERAGDRARAGHARLLGNLDRPRQRQR